MWKPERKYQALRENTVKISLPPKWFVFLICYNFYCIMSPYCIHFIVPATFFSEFTSWIWWGKLVVNVERRKASIENPYLWKMSGVRQHYDWGLEYFIITGQVFLLLFLWTVLGRRTSHHVLCPEFCAPLFFVLGM